MWHVTKKKVARWADFLLHIHDTPERTALAFGVGVFIGFNPFVGFHNLMGLALAFMFRLNRVAVLAGCWVNLPWLMVPWYSSTTYVGAWLTGTTMPPDFLDRISLAWHSPTWKERVIELEHTFRPLLLPFIVGAQLLCPIPGYAAYRLSLAFIRARRRASGVSS